MSFAGRTAAARAGGTMHCPLQKECAERLASDNEAVRGCGASMAAVVCPRCALIEAVTPTILASHYRRGNPATAIQHTV